MRTAFAVWNGRISPVFDVTGRVLVVDFEGRREIARWEEALGACDPLGKVDRLVELGVEALVCGAISRQLAGVAGARGIRVAPFTAGPVEAVLAAYAAGALPSVEFSMPGCRGGRRRRRRCGY